MKKILVTGGAGFIGGNACNALASLGYDVIAFDNLSLGRKENLDPKVHFVKGDVNDPAQLASVGSVDHVIHLAASSSAPMFKEALVKSYANNILGYLTLLEYAQAHGVKKVLFASTSSVYGSSAVPLTEDQQISLPNFYAASKYAAEQASELFHKNYGLEIIAFRFMSVYGPHEEHKGRFANLVSQFIWGMEEGKQPIIYGDGTQTRDFTNVADVVQAFKLALETPKQFGFAVFNVGTAEAIMVKDLIPIINKHLKTSIEGKFIPNPIRVGYIESQLGDVGKIKSELGFEPRVSLEEGIAEIVKKRAENPVAPASLSF